MIVDTSAMLAIWRREPGYEQVLAALERADAVAMSAATLVELYAVLDDRAQPENRRRLDALLAAYGVAIIPFTAEQAAIARAAYRDYGRGSGHAAHLNLGDCFAYALASSRREQLLFVGSDFAHTDLVPALSVTG